MNRFKYYYSRFGIDGLKGYLKTKVSDKNNMLKVSWQGVTHPFYLRYKTSDFSTFDQIFIDQEYSFLANRQPNVIVDAGANIGLASIYFANRFPDAKVIAIEPEIGNFELLKINTSPYTNVTPVNAALWNNNEEISILDPGLGNWGFMTQGQDTADSVTYDLCHKIPGMTVGKIIEAFDLSRIDILKMDIEGAELEVFRESGPWIDKIESAIVELHEHIKPGCNRSFYNGSNGFAYEWLQGENVYLSRGSCIVPPAI